MQKDLIKKIDLLVEMSGTNNNFDALSEEFVMLEKQIEKQKSKICNLKKAIANNEYINASERIIDENIKLGIENRISSYEEELYSLDDQITKFLEEEKQKYSEVCSCEEEIKVLSDFLFSLESKLKSTVKGNTETYQFYQKLLNDAHSDIKKAEENSKQVKKEYNEVSEKLEQLTNKKEMLEEKIHKEQGRLEEIVNSLSNPNSYVNKSAKIKDEKTIDLLTDELENLEKRRLEILNDPVFIAQDAKNFLIEEDNSKALFKIKELLTIVLSKPFMDVDNIELDDLLEKAISSRDEFANEIEGKNYSDNNLGAIKIRLAYLEEKKQNILDEINKIKEKIKVIDIEEVKKLITNIESLKSEKNQLEKDISLYQNVINSSKEFTTPKKEASLRAALKKKEEALSFIVQILRDFEFDLEKTVIDSKELETKNLKELEEKVGKIDDEIDAINKKELLVSKSKDILAIEKDKEILKKLNDDVEALINRKKYDQKPVDVFVEIENFLKSTVTDVKPQSTKKEDFINLDDYKIDFGNYEISKINNIIDSKINSEIPNSIELEKTNNLDEFLPTIDLPQVEEKEPIILEPVVDAKIMESFENKDLKNEKERKNTDRWQVVKVEPINTASENIESLDITDEDEYISFNNILEGDDNVGN